MEADHSSTNAATLWERSRQHLMADRSRSIPAICRELGGIPSSTLYHYLHADGSLKEPGRKLLAS